MIPLTNESRRLRNLALGTYSIIGLNILVFILELLGGDQFIYTWSVIPANIVQGQSLITLFTAMFMHAGFAHIIGNMVYLWTFGPAMEDVMGSVPFTIFYLICGLAADALQIFVDPTSQVPNLGASGAIAGVLGGFILVFPRDQIRTLTIFGGFIGANRVSALLLIGFWFVLQLFSGFGSIVSADTGGGGVAYFAHIGGFIAGLILGKLFARRPPNDVAELF